MASLSFTVLLPSFSLLTEKVLFRFTVIQTVFLVVMSEVMPAINTTLPNTTVQRNIFFANVFILHFLLQMKLILSVKGFIKTKTSELWLDHNVFLVLLLISV